ncbi:NF-kappa-B inhibitor zeta [Sebastes umbrosus]|uniref:NF-kappa-B inhibitor zeta n=1 Tax=Sebastes umbrosus TaxID=72105 RepID=UPI00189E31F0|nr:NF-kappa-B inhibitor zeta [Sebastes umbrosus]XP_037617689.1 NF-kappa-B inhibitor zeta [Sebastes umbrosus]
MMLDPRRNDTRGGQIVPMESSFNQDDRGFLTTDPRPPEYVETVHKKTVKELLMMKRQKRSCLQEDNTMEHQFKFAKSEAFPSDLSPCMFGPPGHFLTAPHENGHIIPRQLQPPALQEAPAAEVTLFHWQIQRETLRVGGLSPELLSMQDADGDTFLHIAVAQGRRALAYVLATKMARCGSLDVKEHNGQTALQIAAASNQQLIVHDLLTHGAQINTRDLWGRSPLHLCAEKGHFLSLQSIWRTLMGSGQPIDIEMFNYDGLTALHAAVLSHNAAVKELRSLGNLCSYVAKELLQKRQMYVECIKTLLLMGASCGTKDLKSGRTCLHMASEEANVELFNIFLNQPSSLSVVNVKTFSGNTALHLVSSLQNHKTQVEATKLLMRKGADPGFRNFENELPSQMVPEGPTGEKVLQILKGKHVHA